MIERVGEFAKEHPVATVVALGAMGVALYEKLKPDHEPGENALKIMSNLVDCIENEYANLPEERPIPNYYVVGGGAVAALTDSATVFDFESIPPKVIAKPTLFKAQFRKNGSLGDIDIIVQGDNTDADIIRAALTPNETVLGTDSQKDIDYELSKPGAKLKIGVTPLRPESDYQKKGLLRDFVSERVVDERGHTSLRILDVEVPLTDDYWQVWHQVLTNGVDYIPVMNPVTQVGNYIARTCYDEPRKRDVQKLEDMERVVGPAFGISLRRNPRDKIVGIDAHDPYNPQYGPVIEFLDQKLTRHFQRNKEVLGTSSAAWFAIKQALHKPADTYLEKVGQGGWLFDKVLSPISGERQQKIKR